MDFVNIEYDTSSDSENEYLDEEPDILEDEQGTRIQNYTDEMIEHSNLLNILD